MLEYISNYAKNRWFQGRYRTGRLAFLRVHLCTYDFFAERVGFKLGWGCLVFYPYFYGIGLWATVELPDPNTASWALAFGCVFLTGWILSRGANMQKYLFKPNTVAEFPRG